MLSDTPQWVAVYTRSRTEKRVAELLSQRGIVNYLPIVSRRHKWSDRYKMVDEPLFKSYVFAKIKKTEVDKVRNEQGVATIVSFGGNIVTVPDDQVESIRRLVDAKQELSVLESSALRKGARVRIEEGPFAGTVGVLVSDCKDGNFAVRIDAIGLSLVTSIDRLLVKPLGIKKQKLKT
ncbi:MAG: UpxY family transcription antiterminator [Bacteroidales bacterium]|nr:UpxY family transcription antiterminator [Bacteroidales bacterium]